MVRTAQQSLGGLHAAAQPDAACLQSMLGPQLQQHTPGAARAPHGLPPLPSMPSAAATSTAQGPCGWARTGMPGSTLAPTSPFTGPAPAARGMCLTTACRPCLTTRRQQCHVPSCQTWLRWCGLPARWGMVGEGERRVGWERAQGESRDKRALAGTSRERGGDCRLHGA